MKKIIVMLLVLCMVCTLFAACGDKKATLADAEEYLTATYKSDEGKKTPADYKLIAQIPIEDVTFTVTWTVDLDTITITENNGLYDVDVPSKNEEEVTYTLTATITAADGSTATKTFTRVLPVYDNSAAVTAPVEDEAYKLYLVQANVGKTVFATQTVSTKYIASTTDPKEGADFFAEASGEGYKFYTMIDGAKNYVHAYTTTAEDGKVSKYIGFATESDCVYVYHADVNAWFVTIEGTDYVVGTYSSYETICISEATYISAENTGVSQFPLALMNKEAAEEMEVSEGPKDPTELTSIDKILEIGNAMEHNTQTPEKYLVKGVITEIKSTQYGNMNIQDEAGNTLYIYGVYSKDGATRYDALETKPQVGDTVTLMGVISNYNGPQIKNGALMELIPGEGGATEEPAAVSKTVAEFNEIASAQPDKGDATAEKYSVTVVGVACNYNGPQMKNAWAVSYTTAKTISAFNEIASAQPDKGDATAEKYSVTGVISEIKSDKYGNMYIKDAEGNSLYLYGLYSADGETRYDSMETKPAVGDTITVVGVACNYNGAQMKNGWMTVHTPAAN